MKYIFYTYLILTTYIFIMKVIKAYICYKYQISLIWIIKTAVRVYFFPIALPLDIVQLKRTLKKFEQEREKEK